MAKKTGGESDSPDDKELQTLLERLDVLAEKIRALPCLIDYPDTLADTMEADNPQFVTRVAKVERQP